MPFEKVLTNLLSINEEAVNGAVDIVAAMRDTEAPWVFVVRRGKKRVGVIVEPKSTKPKGSVRPEGSAQPGRKSGAGKRAVR